MRFLRPAVHVGVLVVGVQSARAFACSCVGGDYDPVAERDAHAMVFYGHVLEVRSPTGPRGCGKATLDEKQMHVDLEVIEAFKGVDVGDTVTVGTNRDDAMCGVDFHVGESWLVYTDGTTYALCDPGGQISSEDAELDALRAAP
jgi:hypothetical protein